MALFWQPGPSGRAADWHMSLDTTVSIVMNCASTGNRNADMFWLPKAKEYQCGGTPATCPWKFVQEIGFIEVATGTGTDLCFKWHSESKAECLQTNVLQATFPGLTIIQLFLHGRLDEAHAFIAVWDWFLYQQIMLPIEQLIPAQ